MEVLTEARVMYTVPVGDTDAMDREVRRILGQSVGVGLPRRSGGGIRRPTYQEDLGSTATAMLLNGYSGVTALGPKGSNSHRAAMDIVVALRKRHGLVGSPLSHNPSRSYPRKPVLPIRLLDSMPDIMEAASQTQPLPGGQVGLLPVANSLGGLVRSHCGLDAKPESGTNLGEILSKGLSVLGIIGVEIEHALLAHPNSVADEIRGRHVCSHSQALLQCSGAIDQAGLTPVAYASTSAAAQALASGELSENSLVIAPSWAAELYGLTQLRSSIGDRSPQDNVTLMAVVGSPDPLGERRSDLTRQSEGLHVMCPTPA